MLLLPRYQFFLHALELTLNACNLLLYRPALLVIHFHGRGSGQSSLCPLHNRGHHLQIADQLGARP